MRDKVISKTMVGLLVASAVVTIPMATNTVYATDNNTDVSSTETSITATDAESYIITVYDEYYDADGQLEHRDTRTQDSLEQGSEYYYEALDTPGYTVQGDSVKQGTASKDEEITFSYLSDADPSGENTEPAEEPSEEPADTEDETPTKTPAVKKVSKNTYKVSTKAVKFKKGATKSVKVSTAQVKAVLKKAKTKSTVKKTVYSIDKKYAKYAKINSKTGKITMLKKGKIVVKATLTLKNGKKIVIQIPVTLK